MVDPGHRQGERGAHALGAGPLAGVDRAAQARLGESVREHYRLSQARGVIAFAASDMRVTVLPPWPMTNIALMFSCVRRSVR